MLSLLVGKLYGLGLSIFAIIVLLKERKSQRRDIWSLSAQVRTCSTASPALQKTDVRFLCVLVLATDKSIYPLKHHPPYIYHLDIIIISIIQVNTYIIKVS